MPKLLPINKDLEPPSEQFEDAVIDSGSLAIDCELCGRTHFSTGSPHFYDEGELERLQEKAKAEPERYLENSFDSSSWGMINGRQAVIGCPCNKLREFENFIWNHRFLISKYLIARAKDELACATRQVAAIAPLSASIVPLR